MSTLGIFIRIGMAALALTAGIVLAASPGAAAKRHKPYVYVNKGAETYGDFRTPAGPHRMIVRDRLTGPRWGYIGPHYESRFGPGYHTNGPGIGIER